MPDFTIRQGDLLPKIRATLSDSAGAIDLTGATVEFRMRANGATSLKVDESATVIDAEAGIVEYAWAAGDTDTAGTFRAEFVVTLAGGQQTVPNARYLVVRITPALS